MTEGKLRTNNPYGNVLSAPQESPRPQRDEPSQDLSVGPSISPQQAHSSSPQTGRGVYGQGIVEPTPSTPRHRIVPNNSQFKSPGSGFMSAAAQNGPLLHHESSHLSPHLSPSPMNPSPSPHMNPFNYLASGRTPTPSQRPALQPGTPLIRVGGAPVSQPSFPVPSAQHRANSTPIHTTTIATSFPRQTCTSQSPLPKPAIAPSPGPTTTVTVQVGFRPPPLAGQGQYASSVPQGLGSFPPAATVTVGARPPATPPRHASTPIVQVGTSGGKKAPNSSFQSHMGEFSTSVPERSLSLSISAVETLCIEPPFQPPPPVATAAPASLSTHAHTSATQSPKPSPVAAVPSTPPNEKKKKSKKTPKSTDKAKRASPRTESPECCLVVEEKCEAKEAPPTPQTQPQQHSPKQETPQVKKGNRSTPESKKTTPGKTPPSRNKKQRLPPSNRGSPNSQLVADAQRTPGVSDEPVNATLQEALVTLPQVDHLRYYYSLRNPPAEDMYPATGHMVRQRLKQLNFGQKTPGYQNYRRAVARGLREHGNPDHPVTPRATARISKRRFDDICSEWRRTLHQWDHSPIGSRSQGLPTLIDLGLEPESSREISFDDPQRAAEYATLESPPGGTANGTPAKEDDPVEDDETLPASLLPAQPTPGATLSETPASDNQSGAAVDEEEAAAAANDLGLLAEMSVVEHPLHDQGSQDAPSMLEDDLHLELQMIRPPQ